MCLRLSRQISHLSWSGRAVVFHVSDFVLCLTQLLGFAKLWDSAGHCWQRQLQVDRPWQLEGRGACLGPAAAPVLLELATTSVNVKLAWWKSTSRSYSMNGGLVPRPQWRHCPEGGKKERCYMGHNGLATSNLLAQKFGRHATLNCG